MSSAAGSEYEVDIARNIAKLEAIAEVAASGNLGLDKTVQSYEEGMALLRECYRAIRATGGKIAVLARSADGKSLVEGPFDGSEIKGIIKV